MTTSVDNTTEFPYSSVVLVTDTIGNQGWQGSGVLITPDEVLTASHLLYMQGVGTAANITVIPGFSYTAPNAAPFGVFSGTTIHYLPVQDAGDLISLGQSQYDYAVIHLSKPVQGAGYMDLLPDFGGGTVNVTGYPGTANGVQLTSVQNVVDDPAYTILDGTSLGPGSSGGPVWIDENGTPDVVGLVSSGYPYTNAPGYDALITSGVLNQIEAWVQQDDGTTAEPQGLAVFDTSTQTPGDPTSAPYVGPVSNIQGEYITLTDNNVNVTAATPNWFIHTGAGNDAIAVTSGTNVLDGGTGSNFLTGGSGSDTFFVDDRSPSADIWSTIVNFHAGDATTVWGVTPTAFKLNWDDGQGASGYTGLTAHFSSAGAHTASFTLAGYSEADLSNGRLSFSYGTVDGALYMYIHANS